MKDVENEVMIFSILYT